MLEDVFGWVVVLIGAVVMRFTDFHYIDPIMSIFVAAFILVNAIRSLKEIIDLFLEKIPNGLDVGHICEHLKDIEGVEDIHHIHIRTTDGYNNYATMHVVTDSESTTVKKRVRAELKELGICHSTLEIERTDEECGERSCHIEYSAYNGHHHHHHHHHHDHHGHHDHHDEHDHCCQNEVDSEK